MKKRKRYSRQRVTLNLNDIDSDCDMYHHGDYVRSNKYLKDASISKFPTYKQGWYANNKCIRSVKQYFNAAKDLKISFH